MTHKILLVITKILGHLINTKSNRIIFRSMNSTRYNCNPKYISEYLSNHYNGKFDIIWVLNDKEKYSFLKNDNIKITSSKSLKTTYYYLSSKFIVDNNGAPKYISYKNDQIIINTWHGGGSYKRRENDVVKKEPIEIYTKYLSSCRSFSVNNLINCYDNIDKSIIFETGSPRNDIFFNKAEIQNAKKKVKKYLDVDDNTKIILYAPTYKENENNSKTYTLETDKIIKAFQQRFGGEYVFAIRDHKYSHMKYNITSNSKLINTDSYDDLQEVICASDAVITDYSSIMWDVSFTDIPCFIYANDIDEYVNSRNFYTPIEKWPFPVAENIDELKNNILNFDEQKYNENIKEHHKNLGSFENGNACQQVCNYIIKNCK